MTEMEDLHWDSARSSDGVAQLLGRGRVLMALSMSLLAVVAYLGMQPEAVGRAFDGGRVLPRDSRTSQQRRDAVLDARQSSTSQRPIRRMALNGALWDDTVARFPALVEGEALTRVRQVADRLESAAQADGFRFQVDIVQSSMEHEYAFVDGRLLLTSGLVERLGTPGQIAAALAPMMERVMVSRDSRQLAMPYGRLAVAMAARAGFDPRGMMWLIDHRYRLVAPSSPQSAERLELLRSQRQQVATEIAAAFPAGVPDMLVK